MPSDKFRVEVAGSVVRYRKNGVVFYTSLLPATFPLLFDCSLNTTGLNLVDARIGQTSFMRGRRRFGLGGQARQDGAVGWNAGAVSSRRIRSGDGSAAFTASETNKKRAAGLSNGDTDKTAADIDFAIVLERQRDGRRCRKAASRVASWAPMSAATASAWSSSAGVVIYLQNQQLKLHERRGAAATRSGRTRRSTTRAPPSRTSW